MAGQPRWQHPNNDHCPISGYLLGSDVFVAAWNTRTPDHAQIRADALREAAQAAHDATTHPSAYACKAAILAHPAAPLSDPRVVALVKAARTLADAVIEYGRVNGEQKHNVKQVRATIRAIGGEA